MWNFDFRLKAEDINLVISQVFGKQTALEEKKPQKIFDIMMNQTSTIPRENIPDVPPLLLQQFVCSISHANNLDSCCRIKMRDDHINYHTIDPMVSITCDYKTKDSTVLLGHIHVSLIFLN